jgi:hypothetical protein
LTGVAGESVLVKGGLFLSYTQAIVSAKCGWFFLSSLNILQAFLRPVSCLPSTLHMLNGFHRSLHNQRLITSCTRSNGQPRMADGSRVLFHLLIFVVVFICCPNSVPWRPHIGLLITSWRSVPHSLLIAFLTVIFMSPCTRKILYLPLY